MNSYEVNFDGIVGPTHNYSGLSFGNIASVENRQSVSNPKQAALQGLYKMKFLKDLGCKQGILLPQERPHVPTLRLLGFCGTDEQVIAEAFKHYPELLFACSSASSMWAANAATISPSADSSDRRVHISPANLSSKLHRSIEYPFTSAMLQAAFPDPRIFVHHPILPPTSYFADEGAANHTRFCNQFDNPGVQLFVFGRYASREDQFKSSLFPARQTYEASQAIARRHLVDPSKAIFAQQHPAAVDAGVFHNDVIAVGHKHVFLYHENAFVDKKSLIDSLKAQMPNIILIEVPVARVTLPEAVSSYLFNSQIISLNNDHMMLLAPSECQEISSVHQFIAEMITDSGNPINQVHYFNLRESMRNGGGPACLRLRIVLNDEELAAVNPHVLLSNSLYNDLIEWVEKHYRDRLAPQDLADPLLLKESRQALDELTRIMHLRSIYDFQKGNDERRQEHG